MPDNRKKDEMWKLMDDNMFEVMWLGDLFKAMVENYNKHETWRNIPLGKDAFALFERLPDVVPGEIESPADRVSLLSQMLSVMDELSTPRFCLKVRDYMHGYCPDDEDNNAAMERLKAYIDPAVTNDEWSRRYHGRSLKFDPVERSEEWEEAIYDAEQECSSQLAGQSRGMGFCFSYWSALHAALLKRGIDWRNPRQMNPRVLFD